MRGSRAFLLSRRVVGALTLAVGLLASAVSGSAQDVGLYPHLKGGKWVRAANLKDSMGRFQARQEHSAVALNGFVYVIGGFVPIQPPPAPTENDPEPFAFTPTAEVLAYIPAGHPAAGGATRGVWRSLNQASWFPEADRHHIMSVAHQGKIWSFGGHAGGFSPTDSVYVFTPDRPDKPEGTWNMVRVSDGKPCNPATDACLKLPEPRSAGSAVSFGDRIYVIGGVIPNAGAADPVNESIRTTNSVIYLDTTQFPLTWRVAPALIESREHFGAVAVDGRIWVFNGRGERSTHMRGVESWAPGEASWRREPDAPIGASANVLAAIGECVYSFGGEFIAANVTGTVENSQVFDVKNRTWRLLDSAVEKETLDATGATNKHGTYGIPFVENGVTKIMSPGGASTAWFDPMSKVHVFTPPARCDKGD